MGVRVACADGQLPPFVVAVGMIRTLPAALCTKHAAPDRRGAILGWLDAAGSTCRIVLPTMGGFIADTRGLPHCFGLQAGLCAAGVVLLEVWRRGWSGEAEPHDGREKSD